MADWRAVARRASGGVLLAAGLLFIGAQSHEAQVYFGTALILGGGVVLALKPRWLERTALAAVCGLACVAYVAPSPAAPIVGIMVAFLACAVMMVASAWWERYEYAWRARLRRIAPPLLAASLGGVVVAALAGATANCSMSEASTEQPWSVAPETSAAGACMRSCMDLFNSCTQGCHGDVLCAAGCDEQRRRCLESCSWK